MSASANYEVKIFRAIETQINEPLNCVSVSSRPRFVRPYPGITTLAFNVFESMTTINLDLTNSSFSYLQKRVSLNRFSCSAFKCLNGRLRLLAYQFNDCEYCHFL